MNKNGIKYLLAGLIGAILGGFSAIMITKAIPKMMAEMMPLMMENMKVCMEAGDCDPKEI